MHLIILLLLLCFPYLFVTKNMFMMYEKSCSDQQLATKFKVKIRFIKSRAKVKFTITITIHSLVAATVNFCLLL